MKGRGLFGTELAALVPVSSPEEAAIVAAHGALPVVDRFGAVPPPFALRAPAGTAVSTPPAAVLILDRSGGNAALGHLCLRRAGTLVDADEAAEAGADALLLQAHGADGNVDDDRTLALLSALPERLAFLPAVAALGGASAGLDALGRGAAGLMVPLGALADPALRAALAGRVRRRDSARDQREAAALRANLRRRKAFLPR